MLFDTWPKVLSQCTQLQLHHTNRQTEICKLFLSRIRLLSRKIDRRVDIFLTSSPVNHSSACLSILRAWCVLHSVMAWRRSSNFTLNTQDIFSSGTSEEPHFCPIHTPAITENPILHVVLDSLTHNWDNVVRFLAGCFVIKDSSTHEFIQRASLNVSSNQTVSTYLLFDIHHAIGVVSVLVDYSMLYFNSYLDEIRGTARKLGVPYLNCSWLEVQR